MGAAFDRITLDRPRQRPDAGLDEAGLDRAWVIVAQDDDDEDDLDDADGEDGEDEDEEDEEDPPGWSD